MLFIGEITEITAIFWFVISIYVYFDTSNHGESHPCIWTIVSWFIPFAWIYWLIVGLPIKEK